MSKHRNRCVLACVSYSKRGTCIACYASYGVNEVLLQRDFRAFGTLTVVDQSICHLGGFVLAVAFIAVIFRNPRQTQQAVTAFFVRSYSCANLMNRDLSARTPDQLTFVVRTTAGWIQSISDHKPSSIFHCFSLSPRRKAHKSFSDNFVSYSIQFLTNIYHHDHHHHQYQQH